MTRVPSESLAPTAADAGLVIRPVGRGAAAPLSSAQRRIYVAYRLGAVGAEYAYPLAFRLRGDLDVAALRRAVDLLVERHEALRTTFSERDGVPQQSVREPLASVLAVRPVGDAEEVERAVADVVEESFDLANGPIFRAALLEVGPQDHVLVLVAHHIAIDARSAEVLVGELGAAYSTYGAASEAPPAVQYADFAAWENAQIASGELATHAEYWRAQLAGVSHALALPTDRPRPERQSFGGDWSAVRVGRGTARGVAELAAVEEASQEDVLFAAFALFLSRWTGRDELVVGAPAPGRPIRELDDAVGFFVNVLPIRLFVEERRSFWELVRHVHETRENAREYEGFSFDDVAEQLRVDRTLAHDPLVQATFACEDPPVLELEGVEVEWLDARPRVSRYDVACDYRNAGDTFELELSYATELFERATIETAATRLLSTLDAAVTEPDRPLLGLDAVSPGERARIAAWETGPTAPPARSVVTRFVEAARSQGGRRAVLADGVTLTFAELEARTRAIAGGLRARGVAPEEVVGVSTVRSAALPASILGVLRAGAAYVPLDPAHPPRRLRVIAHDAGLRFVLAGADASAAIGGALGDTVTILDPDELDGGDAPAAEPHPAALAYVLYTSGSTGSPKGVCVTHGGIANLLAALEARGVASSDRGVVGWNASASFDASVQQWIRLARGDSLVVLDDGHRGDPDRLRELLAREGVAELDLTPSHLAAIVDRLELGAATPPMRLLVGGEAIRPPLWQTLRDLDRDGAATAVNLYGPTECTVDATVAEVGDAEWPTIGRPLGGVRAYVLDRWFRRVPEGAYGELYIGGAGVARGYLGRRALTAGAFVPDPYAGAGARMYRTGDRARWRDGLLEFAGRLDDQVKIRGFRVEPGEIASALEGVGAVAHAVVVPRGDGGGLAAYFTSREPLEPAELERELRERLPDYMLPSTIAQVDRIPLTPSGKVDRSKLPEPERGQASDGDGAAETRREPLGPIEQLIADVWAEVLGVDAVAADENFFALGGHSIMAIRVVARLKKRLNLAIPMTAVFEHPSVRELAAYAQSEMLAKLAATGAA